MDDTQGMRFATTRVLNNIALSLATKLRLANKHLDLVSTRKR